MPIHDWKRVPAGIFHDFHQVPLETTYQSAFDALPNRWREVLTRPAA